MPTLGEGRHRSLARRLVSVRWCMGSLIISDVSERLELVRSCRSFSQGPRLQ